MSARPVLIILYLCLHNMYVITSSASIVIEEVFVTGSRIVDGNLHSGSPVTIVSQDLIKNYGLSSVSDIIHYLPFNTGSEFNADVFTQNLSVGTSNFNLRGLGLSSTLVLLNGKRQTVSGAVSDDGSTFVDSNALVPISIVDRIEILKDGSSALYGSDAVAGVVNVITKQDLVGLELLARTGVTTQSSQTDILLGGNYGFGMGRLQGYGAVEYEHQSWLPSPTREFTIGKGVSSFGQPGSFILLEKSETFPELPFGEQNRQSVIDPACSQEQRKEVDTRDSRLGLCLFDFSEYYHLVPREERLSSFFSMSFEGQSFNTYADWGYVRMDAKRGTSPSFPILNLVTIPANNPGNIFNTPALFLGRAQGNSSPVNLVQHLSETRRASFGFRNNINSLLSWNIGFSYSDNSYEVKIQDILSDRFSAAVNGKGGPNNNLFFNPFGSASLVADSDPRYNSPLVVQDFLSTAHYQFKTSMYDISGNIAKKIVNTDTIDISASTGFQWRRESITANFNDQFNMNNYLFLIGGPDFSGNQNVLSGFGELYINLYDFISLQLALRKEFYDSVDSAVTPKLSLSWDLGSMMEIYASYSTAFRTPSTYQKFSSQTVLQNIFDPLTQSQVFRGVRTNGDTSLKPETAKVYSIGYIFSPVSSFSVNVALWKFDYKNLIVKENAQAIVNSAPLDPRIIRNQGQILRIDSSYINASSVTTDGFDISSSLLLADTTSETWRVKAELTYINSYKIQPNALSQSKEVSGNRNFSNFARSLPKWRSVLSMEWEDDSNSFTALMRTISGYIDDHNQKAISKHITLDAYAALALPSFINHFVSPPVLTFGLLNVFDNNPPSVATPVGYDSKVHDPRGRIFYIGFKSNL